MPSRFWSIVILVYWSIAAFWLCRDDVLPEFALGNPPDLRAIAMAGNSDRPTHWSILVVDNPKDPDSRRAVGEAVTASARTAKEGYELTSHVDFDAGGILRGTPFASRVTSMRLLIDSRYEVDASGKLLSMLLQVKSPDSKETLIEVKGAPLGKLMQIVSRGPVPLLNQHWTFDYEPGSVIHDALRPLDRLPGLHVGQRWETRVVNPFTGRVDRARVEVVGRGLIQWNGQAVSTFEVVQTVAPLVARTWVKMDGEILRQEVPFPLTRIILERKPDAEAPANPAGTTKP